MMLFLRIARISVTVQITTYYSFVTMFVNVSGVSIALVPLCVQRSRPSVVLVVYSPALSFSAFLRSCVRFRWQLEQTISHFWISAQIRVHDLPPASEMLNSLISSGR
jgi:hypothetical protein